MDVNKITASHKDPVRAEVGKTAFMAAVARACASTIRKPLVRDPVACEMFSWRSIRKGVPAYFVLVFSLWKLLPFTAIVFSFIKVVFGRDFYACKPYSHDITTL
jgi:hypothetical protein